MKIITVLFILVLLILYWSCSENVEPVPSVTHPSEWLVKGSTQFHGSKAESSGLSTCRSCHGVDLNGGESGTSCYSTKCHPSAHSTSSWSEDTTSANFHGIYLKASDWMVMECSSCHGSDYKGGISEVSCSVCHRSYPHSDGWNSASSQNFHGLQLKNSVYELADCQPCHGTDFDGGRSEVSCNACHASYPHKPSWSNKNSPEFHGSYLKQNNWSLDACQNCHGSDYQGGSSGVSCFTCHDIYPHDDNWLVEDTEGFHGEYLESRDWDNSSCKNCHGDDLMGGRTEISCFTCHGSYPHSDGWLNISTEEFHGNFIRNNGWSLQSCQDCHGSDYTGENTMVSCRTCHTGSTGPEACNTCHGNFSMELPLNNWAPPEDLEKHTATTFRGVGAHQVHLAASTLTSTYALDCTICHRALTGFDDPNHIDANPDIEIEFNEIATDSGHVAPNWNRTTTTCSDVYCHGNFKFPRTNSENEADSVIVGNNPDLDWTQVGTGQADCGTCHGLPPTGHAAVTIKCVFCHSSVVDENNNIIDKSKHINGRIDTL